MEKWEEIRKQKAKIRKSKSKWEAAVPRSGGSKAGGEAPRLAQPQLTYTSGPLLRQQLILIPSSQMQLIRTSNT